MFDYNLFDSVGARAECFDHLIAILPGGVIIAEIKASRFLPTELKLKIQVGNNFRGRLHAQPLHLPKQV